MPTDPFEHVMPWQPGPIGSSGFSVARVLARQGYSREQIVSHLREYNARGMRPQEIGRAASAAVTWQQTMQAVEGQGGGTKVPRAAMTRNENLQNAHRYVVEYTFPNAPGGITFRTVVINSDRNLSLDELRARGDETYRTAENFSERMRGLLETQEPTMRIMTAERRTG